LENGNLIADKLMSMGCGLKLIINKVFARLKDELVSIHVLQFCAVIVKVGMCSGKSLVSNSTVVRTVQVGIAPYLVCAA